MVSSVSTCSVVCESCCCTSWLQQWSCLFCEQHGQVFVVWEGAAMQVDGLLVDDLHRPFYAWSLVQHTTDCCTGVECSATTPCMCRHVPLPPVGVNTEGNVIPYCPVLPPLHRACSAPSDWLKLFGVILLTVNTRAWFAGRQFGRSQSHTVAFHRQH